MIGATSRVLQDAGASLALEPIPTNWLARVVPPIIAKAGGRLKGGTNVFCDSLTDYVQSVYIDGHNLSKRPLRFYGHRAWGRRRTPTHDLESGKIQGCFEARGIAGITVLLSSSIWRICKVLGREWWVGQRSTFRNCRRARQSACVRVVTR